ncbi:MAG: hypothetical protein NTY61_01995 [Candidatus Parcubacteria bacterium]|nr:hypothetical protein [Candidatus Parcubacteria bacterium]
MKNKFLIGLVIISLFISVGFFGLKVAMADDTGFWQLLSGMLTTSYPVKISTSTSNNALHVENAGAGNGINVLAQDIGLNIGGGRHGVVINVGTGAGDYGVVTNLNAAFGTGYSVSGVTADTVGYWAQNVSTAIKTTNTPVAADLQGSFILRDNAGSGNAYACFDSQGKLFRSGTPCSTVPTEPSTVSPTVPSAPISSIPTPTINTTPTTNTTITNNKVSALPDGTLVKVVNQPTVYVVNGTEIDPISGPTAFKANGYQWKDVKSISAKTIDPYAIGATIAAPTQ